MIIVKCGRVKAQRLSLDDIRFYGESIFEVVGYFSYLGFLVHGNFQAQYLADRGLRALCSIQGIAYELIDPKPELLCMLFDRIMNYFTHVNYGDSTLLRRWGGYI